MLFGVLWFELLEINGFVVFCLCCLSVGINLDFVQSVQLCFNVSCSRFTNIALMLFFKIIIDALLVVDIALFSALEQTHCDLVACDSQRVTVALCSAYEYPTK